MVHTYPISASQHTSTDYIAYIYSAQIPEEYRPRTDIKVSFPNAGGDNTVCTLLMYASGGMVIRTAKANQIVNGAVAFTYYTS